MRLKSKGFIYYELLIGLFIIFMLVPLVIEMNHILKQEMKDKRFNYEMMNLFYMNLYNLEHQLPLIESNDYQIKFDDTTFCMEWTDLYGKNQTYCETYWL